MKVRTQCRIRKKFQNQGWIRIISITYFHTPFSTKWELITYPLIFQNSSVCTPIFFVIPWFLPTRKNPVNYFRFFWVILLLNNFVANLRNFFEKKINEKTFQKSLWKILGQKIKLVSASFGYLSIIFLL